MFSLASNQRGYISLQFVRGVDGGVDCFVDGAFGNRSFGRAVVYHLAINMESQTGKLEYLPDKT
uniref:Uncharacterized protein n=1 Tax=Romanomermis culicivorax TaxID=13658 RepID=A0A915KVQ9_ROMCU